MNKGIVLSLLLALSNFAFAEHIWVETVPTQLRLLSPGLVLIGTYSNIDKVECQTNPSAVFLPNTDPQFDLKVSMALAAQAQGKAIQFLINNIGDPSTCKTISAHGSVATVFDYYWYIK